MKHTRASVIKRVEHEYRLLGRIVKHLGFEEHRRKHLDPLIAAKTPTRRAAR